MWKATSILLSVLVGVLLAGPLAALAMVALPERWRGPVVPWGVAGLAIALVVFVRRPKSP